jgi:hypothetical protein
MDNMEQDYEERPELDRYDLDQLDDEEQNELSMAGRMQVDEQLNREERMHQLGRRPGALMDEEDEDDEEILNQMRKDRLKKMREGGFDHGMHDSQEDPNNVLDFTDVRGPLFVWLKKQDVIKYVKRSFEQFLRHFKSEDDQYLYE